MGQIIVDIVFAIYFAIAGVGAIVAVGCSWQYYQSFDDKSDPPSPGLTSPQS